MMILLTVVEVLVATKTYKCNRPEKKALAISMIDQNNQPGLQVTGIFFKHTSSWSTGRRSSHK